MIRERIPDRPRCQLEYKGIWTLFSDFTNFQDKLQNPPKTNLIFEEVVPDKKREALEYWKMDLADLQFEDKSFQVIVDQGTLDAIMLDNSLKSPETTDKIFFEYRRVLKNGGLYICFTLAQEYILKKIMDYFPKNGWSVRVHMVLMSEEKSANNLPVFAFVMTKDINLSEKNLEICLEDSSTPERAENEEKIINFVKKQQRVVAVKASLNKELNSTKDYPLIRHFTTTCATYPVPRFVMNIIDNSNSKLLHNFGVLIVPLGSESNLQYRTNKGRRRVAEQTSCCRVLFVSLHPWYSYGTKKDLQRELNSIVMDYVPPGTKPINNILYLPTTTEDSGDRFVIDKSESPKNGFYIVVDYTKDDRTWYRHLIFMAQPRIIQCEIRLKDTTRKPIKQGKKKLGIDKRIPDHTFLASGYAQHVLAGILLKFSREEKFKALMIGVCGGALSTFIVHNFVNCHLTAVEIDHVMVKVAQKRFGLPKNMYERRFKVHAKDGIKFVQDEEKRYKQDADTEKYDIIVIDVNGQENDQGIICPAIAFVELDYLKSIFHVLKPDGMLMINLLCLKAEMRSKVMYNIRRIFKVVGILSCEAYRNELMYCFKTKPNFKLPTLTKSAKNRNRKKKREEQDISPQKVDSNGKSVETGKCLNSVSIAPSSHQNGDRGHIEGVLTKSAKKRNKKKKRREQDISPQNVDFNEKLVETEKCLNSVSIAPLSYRNVVEGHIDGDTNVKGGIHGDAGVKRDSIDENHGVKDCNNGSESSTKNNENALIPENWSLNDENFIPPVDKKPINLKNYDLDLFKYWEERTKVWEREGSIELSTLIETVSIEQDVDYYMMLK